ncbi:hypothetical protein CsSME_00047069 [Camellia sinensis var. sinensis]
MVAWVEDDRGRTGGNAEPYMAIGWWPSSFHTFVLCELLPWLAGIDASSSVHMILCKKLDDRTFKKLNFIPGI